ncbi:hypothetical protein VTO73DRAFT_3209 [Trametes versicolor]
MYLSFRSIYSAGGVLHPVLEPELEEAPSNAPGREPWCCALSPKIEARALRQASEVGDADALRDVGLAQGLSGGDASCYAAPGGTTAVTPHPETSSAPPTSVDSAAADAHVNSVPPPMPLRCIIRLGASFRALRALRLAGAASSSVRTAGQVATTAAANRGAPPLLVLQSFPGGHWPGLQRRIRTYAGSKQAAKRSAARFVDVSDREVRVRAHVSAGECLLALAGDNA